MFMYILLIVYYIMCMNCARAVETVLWLPVGEGATEAEALVAALEGAP